MLNQNVGFQSVPGMCLNPPIPESTVSGMVGEICRLCCELEESLGNIKYTLTGESEAQCNPVGIRESPIPAALAPKLSLIQDSLLRAINHKNRISFKLGE